MENIYNLIVTDDKLNEKFKLLVENPLFDPAKNIIDCRLRH